MQRSGLPLMILAGVILAIAVAAVLLIVDPFGMRAPSGAEPPAPAPAAAEPPAAPPPPPAPAQSVPLRVTIPASTHTVRRGDTLFDLAGERWDDPYLWPLVFVANRQALPDPDYLVPGQRIAVPAWVTPGSGLTADERLEISVAHVEAHRTYAGLGAQAIGLGTNQPAAFLARLARVRLNKADWVLYSGLRYDPSLLETFADRIDPAYVGRVRQFVARFGLPRYRPD